MFSKQPDPTLGQLQALTSLFTLPLLQMGRRVGTHGEEMASGHDSQEGEQSQQLADGHWAWLD